MPFYKLRLFFGGYSRHPHEAEKETEKEADKVKYSKTQYHKYHKTQAFFVFSKGHFSSTLSTMHTAKGHVNQVKNKNCGVAFEWLAYMFMIQIYGIKIWLHRASGRGTKLN